VGDKVKVGVNTGVNVSWGISVIITGVSVKVDSALVTIIGVAVGVLEPGKLQAREMIPRKMMMLRIFFNIFLLLKETGNIKG
jgi:hypothetical protein